MARNLGLDKRGFRGRAGTRPTVQDAAWQARRARLTRDLRCRHSLDPGPASGLDGRSLAPSFRLTLPLIPDFSSPTSSNSRLSFSTAPCPFRFAQPPSPFFPLDSRTPSHLPVRRALDPLLFPRTASPPWPPPAPQPRPPRSLVPPWRPPSALIPSAFPNPNLNSHTPPLTFSALVSIRYKKRFWGIFPGFPGVFR